MENKSSQESHVLFCQTAALAFTICHVYYQLKKDYLYSLEIVINSSCTSEIIPQMYTRECWPSYSNSETICKSLCGDGIRWWVLQVSIVLYLSPMGILSSSKYEILQISFLSGKQSFKISPQHFNSTWVLNCHCDYHVTFIFKMFSTLKPHFWRGEGGRLQITVLFVLTATPGMFL